MVIIAVGKGHRSAVTMAFVCMPGARVSATVRPRHSTLALTRVFVPLPAVVGALWVAHGALPVPHIVQIFTFVHVPVLPLLKALALFFTSALASLAFIIRISGQLDLYGVGAS